MNYKGTTMRYKFYSSFDCVQDIPNFDKLSLDGRVDVINFMQRNIHDVDLCIQAAENEAPGIILYNKQGELISAAGWKVIQALGKGKDGITFLGHRYNDPSKSIKTVKCLSKYAQGYSNHTVLFNEIFKRTKVDNRNFFKLQLRTNYTYYNSSIPLIEIPDNEIISYLPNLCKMNSWAIKNTGFAFWDFGFGSGKNYMLNDKKELRWIDYGGAGLVRCPDFDSIYEKNSYVLSDVAVELKSPMAGKESLIIANSNFLMCQFLLHIEYFSNPESNADVWSSMLQIKRSVVDEFAGVMPDLLKLDITKLLFDKFKNRNWTDYIVWKQIGNFINENT